MSRRRFRRSCPNGKVKSGPRKGRCRKHSIGGNLLGKAAKRCKGTKRQFHSCVRGQIQMLKSLRGR